MGTILLQNFPYKTIRQIFRFIDCAIAALISATFWNVILRPHLTMQLHVEWVHSFCRATNLPTARWQHLPNVIAIGHYPVKTI